MQSLTVKTFALLTALAAFGISSASAEEWTVDSVHSSVTFAIPYMNLVPYRGLINKISGKIDPDAGTGQITIDPATVFTANKKRDDHLRSPDFFNVKQFPAWTFTASKVEKKSDELWHVTGEIDIKGKKKTMTLPVTVSKAVKHPMMGVMVRGLSTEFELDNAEFNLVASDKLKPMLGAKTTVQLGLLVKGSK